MKCNLNGKMLKNPNKTYKDLKQKQKAKISEWLYIETFRFYQQKAHMPNQSERLTILDTVYLKIEDAAICIPFGEVKKYYQSRLIPYEKRIQREITK